ncbi:hypothetical protein R3P38DRAFT_2809187 [Favolaschia claudopus]|uniref:Uncharacterized protein n=1 Tax=Favolaschia claudopus TaxID=2862362 RepID=A0AAV9ZDY8_9AGAR
MSRPEILRSGEYWQDLRRRKREADAAREARQAGEAEDAPSLCDGTQVFTFAPGHSQPFVSVQHPGGKLLPVTGPSASSSPETRRRIQREAARTKKRCDLERDRRLATSKALKQKSDAADAALLARLQRGSAGSKKHSLASADDVRPAKKRLVSSV